MSTSTDHVMVYAHLLRVKDDVELAHVLEEAIKRLDEHLDQVEHSELRLILVDHHAEEQRRVLRGRGADVWRRHGAGVARAWRGG